MSPDKLVTMANQIGKFFAHQGADKAAASTAHHLEQFWEPRLRAAIVSYLDGGGEGLDPVVRQAVSRLKNPRK